MNKKANIAFWGADVDEITSLVHALKTGEYVRRQGSVHPLSEETIIGNVTITASVPSANMGSGLAWRSYLSDHDGIVYVVDARDPAGLALSKAELDDLLNDETLSKPILVLALKSNTFGEEELRQQLNIEGALTKGEPSVAFFTYSISSTQVEGTEEGFRWLLQDV